jgi:hypothetical protein
MDCRVAVLVSLAGLGAFVCAGCCPVTPGPTGPTASFSGDLRAGGVSFHDYPPPDGTTQMDVVVTWSDQAIQLRLMLIDPDCDPQQRDDCRRFTDILGPAPTGASPTIRTIATNQGPTAGPRMRFAIVNESAERSTAYTMSVAPRRAGCT